ncbi:rhodopsin [Leptolyngbya sp. NIES-3755]|nr:rhodopsin [Leptolyngbya sp. NIES-3755]
MTQETWLWLGCLSMTAGAIFFGFGAERAKNDRWQVVYVLNFFICAIAAVLYLAMTQKQGFNVIFDRPTFWVRYVTWTFSTPLTIVLLSYLGKTKPAILGSMIGADVLMIATGFVAAISPKPTTNLWYIVSCGFYLGLAYLLLKHYREQAINAFPRSKSVFNRLLTVHLVIWTLYPVVWILARTGINVINSTTETAFYTILDVAAKVGFGFLALSSLQKLEKAESTEVGFDRIPVSQ